MKLKAEIEKLKQQKQNSNSTETKTHEESNSTSENSKTTLHPKDVQEFLKLEFQSTRITECDNGH